MPTYDVITPVEHDGQRIESGTIDLDAEAAAPLLAAGAISGPVDEPVKKGKR